MLRIIFIDSEGMRHQLDAEAGLSVMEVARSNNIPGIEAECGGACACATCHVFLDAQWMTIAGGPGEDEAAMLEFAANVGPSSRLSCQITLSDELDGLTLQIPASQY